MRNIIAIFLIMTSSHCLGQQVDTSFAKQEAIFTELSDYHKQLRRNGHTPSKAELLGEYKLILKKYKELCDLASDDPEQQKLYLSMLKMTEVIISGLEK